MSRDLILRYQVTIDGVDKQEPFVSGHDALALAQRCKRDEPEAIVAIVLYPTDVLGRAER